MWWGWKSRLIHRVNQNCWFDIIRMFFSRPHNFTIDLEVEGRRGITFFSVNRPGCSKLHVTICISWFSPFVWRYTLSSFTDSATPCSYLLCFNQVTQLPPVFHWLCHYKHHSSMNWLLDCSSLSLFGFLVANSACLWFSSIACSPVNDQAFCSRLMTLSDFCKFLVTF